MAEGYKSIRWSSYAQKQEKQRSEPKFNASTSLDVID